MWLVLHDGEATACCECGWRGTCRPPEPGAVRATAETHAAETGHRLHVEPDPRATPAGRWLHRCGWVHGWDDHCPVEAGAADDEAAVEDLVRRVLDATTGQVDDRLEAAAELRQCVEELERQAVVAARLDGRTWTWIAAASRPLTRDGALARWGELIGGMEVAGLLPRPPTPPAADPARPEWAERRGVAWCRWCGQRLAMAAGAWAHHHADGTGRVTAAAPDLDDRCPGPVPWPAQDTWTD